jgi:3-methyladenine DNA glycosylase AlkD
MRPRRSSTYPPSCENIIEKLRQLGCPADVEGMARFGIHPDNAFGIRVPILKKLAREMGRNHRLAGQLWATGIHEARGVAAMVDEPELVSDAQAERWVRDFDNWATCDGCCLYLFAYVPFAWRKVFEWGRREREFEKRAAFALAACLAVHDKAAPDERFLKFLPVIKRESNDGRNFVKKAVNWALRQIGKRNRKLNRAAIRTAREIQKLGTPSARWIAADALRELTSAGVQKRLRRMAPPRRPRATSASY